MPLWKSIRTLNQDPQTIVVVPSIDVDIELSPAQMQAYEERYLFLLLLLRQPRARLVYVTGLTIDPSIIDYYLDLMPGVISSHARKRLFPVSPQDGSSGPLSRKLLDRPRLLEKIRSLIPDPNRAHLVPFAATWEDRRLAMELDIPMYGCDPQLASLGTKSRTRRLFAEEGVAHPAGREDVHSVADLRDAIVAMRAADPALKKVVVKHNEGVSGLGNANLDLTGLPPAGSPDEAAAVEALLPHLHFEMPGLTYDGYMAKLAHQGGVVEERIEADEVRSPSVQMRITPLGEVELLSTHDQLLGGESGQSFLGSRFPADPGYVHAITAEAAKLGDRLRREGVLGRFAIDFVVARHAGGEWRPYAIELNLRKGGTTHPFLTLQFLTDGTYSPATGQFLAPSGRAKFFVASDHVESPAYRAFTPEDLFDVAIMRGLHFDQTRQTGVVFHMMSALPEHGRVGITAVGDDPAGADRLYEAAVHALDDEAGTLPGDS